MDYEFIDAVTNICFVLEILAVMVWTCFVWIFRFYFGPEKRAWDALCFVVICAVFFQMALGIDPTWSFEENKEFLLNDIKLVFICLLMLLFSGKRWRDMASMPYGCWERKARLWMSLFVVVAMVIRFIGVWGSDKVNLYRWENGQPATEELMQKYFADKPHPKEVRFFDGEPVYPAKSAIKAAFDDVKAALERKKAREKKKLEQKKRAE